VAAHRHFAVRVTEEQESDWQPSRTWRWPNGRRLSRSRRGLTSSTSAAPDADPTSRGRVTMGSCGRQASEWTIGPKQRLEAISRHCYKKARASDCCAPDMEPGRSAAGETWNDLA
jgi:hypothetical protein